MKRVFVALFIASAISQVGLGIISPILPSYAKTFAANAFQLGLVFAAFSASQVVFGSLLGRLSDRAGRRPMILAGLTGYAVVSVLYASASALWQVGVLRCVQGIASAAVAPIAQAYVGDLIPRGREGRYMNGLHASEFIGLALGPLLGGSIAAVQPYEVAFYAMGGLSIASLLIVWVAVPQDRCRARPAGTKRLPDQQKLLASDAVKGLAAHFVTRGFWRQAFNTFYPLYASSVLGATEAGIGVVLSAYMVAEGLLQIPFGFLADRSPRMWQIALGCVSAPLLLLTVPYGSSNLAVTPIAFAMGASSALGRAPLVAIRTELGRARGMGALAGFQRSSLSVGQMLGPAIGGALADGLGLMSVFPLGAAVGVAGAILTITWLRRSGREEHAAEVSKP